MFSTLATTMDETEQQQIPRCERWIPWELKGNGMKFKKNIFFLLQWPNFCELIFATGMNRNVGVLEWMFINIVQGCFCLFSFRSWLHAMRFLFIFEDFSVEMKEITWDQNNVQRKLYGFSKTKELKTEINIHQAKFIRMTT